MPANYNNSAWFYDQLSRIIFGSSLIKAQVYLLQYIKAGSSIIIIGGGTGWILEEITKVHPSGLNIAYVEASEKMMAKSIKRFTGNNRITYINAPVQQMFTEHRYDVVITPFLLDNFSEQTLPSVFSYIHTLMKPGGLWLNSDFQFTGKWWQKALLKCMVLFFRVVCNIEAQSLPNIKNHFLWCGYTNIAEKTFYSNFIVSSVYKVP
jgi:ubiquinone/menaquinone biosynthesis C-methylase UbiE